MKKILCVMLCLGVVFSLCSCAGLDTIRNAEIPPLPTREATAAPDEPAPENTASPEQGSGGEENTQPEASAGAELGDRVIIYTKKTQEDYGAPDGSIILLFSYVTPKVRIDERPAAAEKINEQLNLLEEAYISGTGNAGGRNHLLESATDNYNYIHDTGASLNTLFTSARTVKGTSASGRACTQAARAAATAITASISTRRQAISFRSILSPPTRKALIRSSLTA